VSTHPDYFTHLADLKRKTAELERELSAARQTLEQEMAQSMLGLDAAREELEDTYRWALGDHNGPDDLGRAEPGRADPGWAAPAGATPEPPPPPDRTAALVDHGRPGAPRRSLPRRIVVAAVATLLAVALVTLLVVVMSGQDASWPASVATVQREIAIACQNPDVRSEPSQVNFACAKGTRQILWVFALMTSGNNPAFGSVKTGRQGLEPITPAQGGEVAWSLNLHHPYRPDNPIDSLEVAARAINNIIGGATLTAANGKPVVQPGLESIADNCARYTGSGAVTSRNGFPNLCAKPLSSSAGQAALVADVYQKWVVGASARAAHKAAVLYQNARNPGDPQVRAILRSLQYPRTG